jgi:microcystin-dependent protein
MPRGQIPFVVTELDGDVLTTAKVLITPRGSSGSVVVTSDEAGTTPTSNPITATPAGRVPGYVPEGSYTATVSILGYAPYTRALEVLAGAGTQVGAGAVLTSNINNGAISAAEVAIDAVTAGKIAANQVTTAKLHDDAVSNRVLGLQVITSSEIVSDAVDSTILADDAVTNLEVADNAVGTLELGALAVTSSKAGLASVAEANLASEAVTGAKIADNQVIASKVDANAIVFDDIAALWLPIGAVLPMTRTITDANWKLCNGQALDRTTYAALFAKLGTTYGLGTSGDGSTFGVPDLQGRMIYGLGTHADVNAFGDNDGLAVGSRKPQHRHSLGVIGNSADTHNHGYSAAIVGSPAAAESGSSGPYNFFYGNSTATIGSSGAHTHGVSGYIGYASYYTQNTPGFATINYYIRVR